MFASASQALRSWSRAKAIAAFATVAAAVGIGSTTAIFTVVNSVLLKPLPYAEGERFVALFGGTVTNPVGRTSSSIADLAEYERRTSSFDAFGWFRLASFNLTAPGEPQHIDGAAVTPSLAHNLGVQPLVGQWFTDETGAVLSYTLWRRLGADRNIVGQGITLGGRRYTVTGVMPQWFRLPVRAAGTEGIESEIWVYLDPSGRGEDARQTAYFAYARRKPGVTLADATRDVERAAAEIAKAEPATHPGYTARLDDLHAAATAGIRPTLLLLFAAAGLLLLITCANVATLLLARSVARARETAVRVALGASQRRLASFYLAEALVVSLAGAAAGIALSVALVRTGVTVAADFIPHADEIQLDWRVLLFSIAAACVTSALTSLAPLWQAARTAPNDVLTSGIRASAGRRARRLSHALVVAEIALAVTLLAVSAALIAHLQNLSRVAAGFDTTNLLSFQLTFGDGTSAPEGRVAYERRLLEVLEALPGVSAAAATSGLPLDGCCFGGTVYPEGSTPASGGAQRNSFLFVSPGYFRTMRIPLRAGRALQESDATSDPPLRIVINEAAAAKYWPDRNPIGATGRLNAANGTLFEIVGVVGDTRNDGLGRAPAPELHFLSSVLPVNPMLFVVRSPLPVEQMISAVRRAVQQVDATLPIHQPTTMDAIVERSLVLERASSLMTAFFAAAAVLLATVGIYGVIAYSVRQRTVELGTRMALGAAGRDVLALVAGDGLKMAAYGVAAGGLAIVVAAWLLARYLEVRGVGLIPFLFSTAVVAGVATLASVVPAWRATLLSPLVAIRHESSQ